MSGMFVGTLISFLTLPIWGTGNAAIAGAITGVAIGVALGVDSWRRGVIETVETLEWSWAHIRASRTAFVVIATFIGIIALLLGTAFGLLIGPLQGLLAFFIIGTGLLVPLVLLVGLSFKNEVSQTSHPNEGIWRSLRAFSAFVLFCALMSGLLMGLLGILLGSLTGNWDIALLAGLTAGTRGVVIGALGGLAIGGLFFGGLACLQHLTLRLILTLRHNVPWNYPHFLNYAVERIFLHKIGGSYIFVHRTVLEYFAKLV
jgi:hypothetical protein